MSNDLISRKSLIENLNKFAPEYYTTLVNDLIMKEPTAFYKEKVIEKMKKTGKRFCVSVRCSEDCQNCEHGVLMKALIEIAEKGGIE